MPITVSVDNFVRAENDRMLNDLQRDSGAVNVFRHNRAPAAIDNQTVIRLNRDTLYSFAVVDITAGATLTLPDAGQRYLSAMVVNRDHYINEIYHDPADYELTGDRFDSDYVVVAIRILVDPEDPADVAEVGRLQDQIGLTSGSAVPFEIPDYEQSSFDDTRTALLSLARHLSAFDRMFGRKEDVDEVRHLIGTAAGWGGLPSSEATYLGNEPRGEIRDSYELTLRDVPVDGFWSISVYNRAGYFEPNESGAYTVNSVTGVKNDDGSITVRFGDFPDGTPNVIPTPDGWNYLARMYRPRAEILDGSWVFPDINS
jgi:hypothetical protein